MLNRKINHVAKEKNFQIVKYNWIRNNPITVEDVRRSHKIYGPPLPTIKRENEIQRDTEDSRNRNFPDTRIAIPRPEEHCVVRLLILCKWSCSIPFHIKKGELQNRTILTELIEELNCIQTQGNI